MTFSALHRNLTALGVWVTLVAALPRPLTAQPAALDPTFNPTDIGFNNGDGANYKIRRTTLLADGKILIAGEFSSYNGTLRNRIARLNNDGSLDTGFNPGMGAYNTIHSLAVQADGKILIGGDFTLYDGTERNRIARLNANGSLDTGFDPGTGANSTVLSIIVQADGKILIGGDFVTVNGIGRNRVARLNADGSLDNGFDPGTGASHKVQAGAVQGDGKILIGGEFTSFNGTGRNRIARLNVDGSLDTGFDPGTGANLGVHSTTVQADGKIVIGGRFSAYNGTMRNRIARLNADGSLDTSFDPGAGANDIVHSTTVQADGKIVIGGEFYAYNGIWRRGIARLNANGNLDASFDPGTGVTGGALNAVFSTDVQADGKILIGGEFTSYNGWTRKQMTRANPNGSMDVDFNPGTGANEVVNSITVQPDGKIIIGGAFTNYNNVGPNFIARLNADGSVDSGFDVGAGPNGAVHCTALQPDGKILIGGRFYIVNGTGYAHIARLNADGSLDNSFVPGTEVSGGYLYAIVVQEDGKILIGGDFYSYNGATHLGVARLNADGSLDTSFNASSAFATTSISAIEVQADGKIIVGGSVTLPGEMFGSGIARLNTDGSLDTSFELGLDLDPSVYDIALQADGKILAVGDLHFYNSTWVENQWCPGKVENRS